MGALSEGGAGAVDARACAAAPLAHPPVAGAWRSLGAIAAGDPPEMGLQAGERPAADVEVLASLVSCAEYELARRLVLAARAGALPLHGPSALLRSRGWSPGAAARLVTAAEVALAFPAVAEQWAVGVITAEHAAAIARARGRLDDEQLAVALRGFEGRWGVLTPRAVGEVIAAIDAALHPPQDPTPGEREAYETRHLVVALTQDAVLLSGSLPRLEGEAFLAVVDAFAESLRSADDQVPAAARRADGLMAMVEAAAASGAVPARGGLPVALTVTLTQTEAGDTVAVTSRGHRLTPAEQRFACCDPTITPVLVAPGANPEGGAGPDDVTVRILAIAEAMLGERLPLAVGRSSRIATPAQRRALAVRDKGCVIPGCGVPAEICQVHHVQEWADGGASDLANEVLLCWTHHRQVDLHMWRIERPPPEGAPPAPPGVSWPANHGSGWVVRRLPRTRWRQ